MSKSVHSSTTGRFELPRSEINGLAIHRLNHSATLSCERNIYNTYTITNTLLPILYKYTYSLFYIFFQIRPPPYYHWKITICHWSIHFTYKTNTLLECQNNNKMNHHDMSYNQINNNTQYAFIHSPTCTIYFGLRKLKG